MACNSGIEAGFEPELEGEVVPFLVGEIGSELLFVTFPQHVFVELTCLCEELGVFQVHGVIPHKLGENQIVYFKGKKM